MSWEACNKFLATVERNHIKLMYVIFNSYWVEFLFDTKPIDIKRLVRDC